MTCFKKLTEDMLFDCVDSPKRGIDGGSAVLINFDDVDKEASTIDGSKITDLVLKSGTTGYSLQWYKETGLANSSFTPSNEDVDGFIQGFQARLGTTTAEHSDRLNELKNGKFIVVYESRYKGDSLASAFKVRGWDVGMKVSESSDNTNENNGSILFTLATEEGFVEKYPYNIFFNTDYATSKIDFEELFSQIIPPVLEDGNTIAWYDYESSEIITDSENRIASVEDISGSGNDVVQASEAAKPLLLSDGIYFDGDDDNLFSGLFTYDQPATIYLVVIQYSWASYRHIIGGGDAWNGSLMQRTVNPNLVIRSDIESAENSTNELFEYQIIRVHFDGANSSIQINEYRAKRKDGKGK